MSGRSQPSVSAMMTTRTYQSTAYTSREATWQGCVHQESVGGLGRALLFGSKKSLLNGLDCTAIRRINPEEAS